MCFRCNSMETYYDINSKEILNGNSKVCCNSNCLEDEGCIKGEKRGTWKLVEIHLEFLNNFSLSRLT